MTNLNIFSKIQKIKYFAVPCTVYYRTLPSAAFTRHFPGPFHIGEASRWHCVAQKEASRWSLPETPAGSLAEPSAASEDSKTPSVKKEKVSHEEYWDDDRIASTRPELIVRGKILVSPKLTHNAFVVSDDKKIPTFGYLARNRAFDGDEVVGVRARRTRNEEEEMKEESACRIVKIVKRSDALNSIVAMLQPPEGSKRLGKLLRFQPLRNNLPAFTVEKKSINQKHLSAIQNIRKGNTRKSALKAPKDGEEADDKSPEKGARVLAILKFLEWNVNEIEPRGVITEIIGDSEVPENQMKIAMLSHGLNPDGFSKEVLDNLNELIKEAMAKKYENREDMRHLYVLSIDPDDAKDLDDALSIEVTTKKGGMINYRIGVHIADVTHYVKQDSVLDLDARERATTVYFEHAVYPMLPRTLSEDLCSLNPSQEKLCFSVFVNVGDSPEAHVMGNDVQAGGPERIGIGAYITEPATFKLTSIISKVRLGYKSAKDVIERALKAWPGSDLVGLSFGEFERTLGTLKLHKTDRVIMRLYFLSQKCRKYRFEECGAVSINLCGGVDFRIPNVYKDGYADNLIVETRDEEESHQLIEEMMLMANTRVAKFLSEKLRLYMLRIHPDTDVDVKKRILSIIPQDIQNELQVGKLNSVQLLRECEKRMSAAAFMHLNFHAFKEFKAALYIPETGKKSIGHWGLAYSFYLHFTSPIRRYADIQVHRMLKNFILGEEHVTSYEELKRICENCNEKSRAAEDASIAYKNIALNQYLKYIPQVAKTYPPELLAQTPLKRYNNTWGYLYKDACISDIFVLEKDDGEDLEGKKVFISFYIPVMKTTRIASCKHLNIQPIDGERSKTSVELKPEDICETSDAELKLLKGTKIVRLDNIRVKMKEKEETFAINQRVSILLVSRKLMWSLEMV